MNEQIKRKLSADWNDLYGRSSTLQHRFSLSLIIAILTVAGVSCSDDSTSERALICESGAVACGTTCCFDTCCDGVCVDTVSDSSHCGQCANACGDRVCVNSECVSQKDACQDSKEWCNGGCVDIASDKDNCGACGTKCGDFETCHNGQCLPNCPSQWTLCGTQCYDLQTDADHCGVCGNACLGNMFCSGGKCVCPVGTSNCDGDATNGCEVKALQCGNATQCKGEAQACGSECCAATCCNENTCADLTSDPLNCGTCGKTCETTQSCQASECIDVEVVCDSEDFTACFGVCANLKNDVNNCGACAKACAYDEHCVEGECQKAILDEDCHKFGYEPCYGHCINTYSDADNCGACNVACQKNEICNKGKCIEDPKAKCDVSETYCYGSCLDTLTNSEHCGSCTTTCQKGEVCIDGLCEPDCGDLTRCDGSCVDIQKNTENCGACAQKCLSGEVCQEGSCICAAGLYDCDGKPENGCESTTPCSCSPGETRACWRGNEENRHKGICQDGTQTCDPTGGFWGPCKGGVYPSLLSCDLAGNLNGLDNDCDGVVDTVCRSTCDLKAGDKSYIGCEYWAVYLYNLIPINHAVVLSNPDANETATVYIFDQAGFENATQAPVYTLKIKPKDVVVQQLNTGTTKMCNSTSIMSNSYRLRSDQPITAYQFNPWGSASAHSNDASLLLPALALGKEYMVMSYMSRSGGEQSAAHTAYLTVIATEPGTTDVTITVKAPIVESGKYNTSGGHAVYSGTPIPAMKAGETRTFTLNRFEVLTLNTTPQSVDLTGTTIASTKNVAVFGGSRSTYVPVNAECCRDHIEEQLFPLQSWGQSYYAARAYSKGKAGDFWRILAQKDNTTVKVSAAAIDGGILKLNAGEFKEFESRENFEIHADKPISVGQFLPSQGYNGLNIGDPSFILTVPYEQYRQDYSFMVPNSFDNNYITIITPKEGTLTLDGNALDISKYEEIASTGFVVGYVELEAGLHRMVGSHPFGLYGYGYYNMSSYGYPIGLDLKDINSN